MLLFSGACAVKSSSGLFCTLEKGLKQKRKHRNFAYFVKIYQHFYIYCSSYVYSIACCHQFPATPISNTIIDMRMPQWGLAKYKYGCLYPGEHYLQLCAIYVLFLLLSFLWSIALVGSACIEKGTSLSHLHLLSSTVRVMPWLQQSQFRRLVVVYRDH